MHYCIQLYYLMQAFGIPECTTNFDTLDLFFRRPEDDSIELKHAAIRIFCVINCLTEIYTLYENPQGKRLEDNTQRFSKGKTNMQEIIGRTIGMSTIKL